MTYRSRGRSLVEVVLVRKSVLFKVEELFGLLALNEMASNIVLYNIFPMITYQAVCFVVFLVGFITVLCIGNYFRAKRAQERQRQRRLAKLAASNNAAGAQGMYATDANYSASYEAPAHVVGGGVQA